MACAGGVVSRGVTRARPPASCRCQGPLWRRQGRGFSDQPQLWKYFHNWIEAQDSLRAPATSPPPPPQSPRLRGGSRQSRLESVHVDQHGGCMNGIRALAAAMRRRIGRASWFMAAKSHCSGSFVSGRPCIRRGLLRLPSGLPAPARRPPAFFLAPPLRPGLPAIC